MAIADNIILIAELKQQIIALELANVLEETGIKVGDIYTRTEGKDKERFNVQSFAFNGSRVKVTGKLTTTETMEAFDLANGWTKVAPII